MAAPQTTPEVGGMGHSIKRKEDPRFIRGKGNYVDDIQLPGMLHMDIVRSPYAHAKIMKIDSEKALKIPGVLAVITGADARAVQAALDADADVGHADGAADRAGHVPGAGGRGRHRDRPLQGGRRRRGGRGRVRAAARSSWTRSRRSSPARRSCARTSRARRTTASSTGRSGTRPETDKAIKGAGRRRQAEDLHPAHPRRLDRDVRLRRRLRPRPRQAHRLHDDAGAARDPHRRSRSWPGTSASRRRRSASSRRTSAAASAARCRSTRATSSRSRPRSSSASRSSGSRTGWRTSRPTPSPATTTWRRSSRRRRTAR